MIEFKDTRQEITIKDFREKFCNECYWQKWGKCDIDTVKLEYCCHALVNTWEYKLI